MTYTSNEPKPLFTAIVARLEASTGKSIGKANAPEDVTTPYAVVYPLPDVDSDGTLDDPDSDVWWGFQITGVGKDMDEAQWMQAEARAALLGWTPTVAGLELSPVELDSGSGITRDPDLRQPVFYSTDRFRVFSSPG
ncbi:MAG: hypothetical protein L0Z63_05735 [Actinobacteria bacterium]|nr:hypothetical protein [Actinomycetota bacterium]